MGTCWECVYHEAYIDEDEDGNLYDDGCICLNEKVDSSLVTDYHATNCPVYEDKILPGALILRRKEPSLRRVVKLG